MYWTQILENTIRTSQEAVGMADDFAKKLIRLNEFALTPPEIRTGQTPSEIVYRKHKTKLLRYIPAREKVYSTPVLVVFALINRPYVLDLLPGKSVVETLVNAGYDVFLVDWGIASDVDYKKGLDMFVNTYLDRMVDQTRKITGSDKVTLMGYCMGGSMSLMYTALHPEKVENLVLMATPFDFTENEGILFHMSKDFPVDELINIYGNCPGWYLNMSFASIRPTDRLEKAVNFYKNMLDDKFIELFLAMEQWSADAVPVPGRAYSEFIKGCFQQNLLMENRFKLGEQTVDLEKVKCSFLNIIAEQDTLVPPSSSEPIGEYIASTDKEVLKCKTGHIGLSVSGKAFKTLWPQVTEWLSTRSGEKIIINEKKEL